ncbi:hypothetical protein [Nostoc sp. NMS4]|nr:hypothetical protein [Nostoc sp. NMS4]
MPNLELWRCLRRAKPTHSQHPSPTARRWREAIAIFSYGYVALS